MNRADAVDRLLGQALTREAGAPAGACPEPEVVAAYVEGGLTPLERQAFESHASTCERCLATLAALPEIPSGLPGGAPEAEARPWWRAYWPWLVPLTAMATAALVYVAVSPVAPPSLSPQATISDGSGAGAQAEATAAAPETVELGRSADSSNVSAEMPPAIIGQKTEGSRSSKADEAAGAGGATKANTNMAEKVQALEPGFAPAPPVSPVSPVAQARTAPSAVVPPAPAAAAAAPPAPAESQMAERDAGRDKAMVAQAAPPAAARGALLPPTAASPAAPPSGAGRRETESPAGVAARAASAEAAPKVEPLRKAAVSTAAGSNEVTGGRVSTLPSTTSPDRSSTWRLLPGGVIERSTDGGRTWRRQSSGVSSELLAASASDQHTCWVVGLAGVVLRTLDGNRWEQVEFPVPADLDRVQANGPHSALVTARDGRAFQTADGGVTWRQVR